MNSTLYQLFNLIVIVHEVAALVIGTIALAVPHWFVHDDVYSGLFDLCANEMRCLDAWPDDVNALLNAVRGTLIASLAVNLLAIFVTIHSLLKKQRTTQRVGAGILFLAGILAIAGLLVSTISSTHISRIFVLNDDVIKGYCYAISWVAAGICCVFGCISFALSFVTAYDK